MPYRSRPNMGAMRIAASCMAAAGASHLGEFRDLYYRSHEDALELYARDYGVPKGPDATDLIVLCLHGLTRNSADFHDIARHLKSRCRVISADQRGRGRSERDANPANYTPAIYARDMIGLLDDLAIDKVVIIGTSMGGLMAMILAATDHDRLQAVIINDIGPEIDPAGLARIASYAGKTMPAANWAEAAQLAELTNAVAFPDYGADDWMAFARRTYVDDIHGVPMLAYDPAISKGLERNSDAPVVPPDLWPLWDALQGLPVLAIRGGLSDLLSAATLEKMAARHAGLTTLTLANRGHAPMLNEPDAVAVIDAFIGTLIGT